MRSGQRLRGASTLTQQVARNLFLWQGRSYLRKGLEAWMAMLLEVFWPKQRILEVYLNIAETGERTFGIEAAARRYFGRSAGTLTPEQAALVAAVLPNPRRLHVDRPSAYVLERRDHILQQMQLLRTCLSRADTAGLTGLMRGTAPPPLFYNHRSAADQQRRRRGMDGFSTFTIIILVLAVVTVMMGIKTVPQGYEWTVERFGRYRKTLRPGLNLIVPYVDRVGHKLNMMESVFDINSQEVITRDNAMIRADGVVFFQILDAAKAAYEVNGLDRAIMNLTMTNIRTVMGSMDLDELLSQRDNINARLLTVVDAATTPWGIKVTRIEIKDIQPPQDLIDAMARQMKAEREKRAVILEAEGQRQSEILRAEGEKRAVVLDAEGRREAAFRDAEARERGAEAEAKATTMVSEAIAKGDINAINYFIAQNYVSALKDIGAAPNQKLVLMPLEAASVIGSLAGIAEVAKTAFRKEAGA